MELLGVSQTTFSGMVSDVGLAAAMRPKMEYTLLAPVNTAFNSKMPFLFAQWRPRWMYPNPF